MISTTVQAPTIPHSQERLSLTSLKLGDKGIILAIEPHNGVGLIDHLDNRLAGLGLVPGAQVLVMRTAQGTIRATLLAIGETRVALDPEIARRITVQV